MQQLRPREKEGEEEEMGEAEEGGERGLSNDVRAKEGEG